MGYSWQYFKNVYEDVKVVTLAQFCQITPNSDELYQVTARVTHLNDNDVVGVFLIEDGGVSVIVYGLTDKTDSKYIDFNELVSSTGLKDGSIITIAGHRMILPDLDMPVIGYAYLLNVQ